MAARLTHKMMMMRMMNMRMAVMSILGYSHLTCKTRPSSRGSLGNWECITLEREYSGEKGGLEFCKATYVGTLTATAIVKAYQYQCYTNSKKRKEYHLTCTLDTDGHL